MYQNNQKLEKTFFSLKTKEIPGHEGVSFNFIKNMLWSAMLITKKILIPPFTSLRVFPDDLRIGKAAPIYRADNSSAISNYRLISLLQFFSKILDWIMCNRLQNIYAKQRGFQIDHYVIAQLVGRISRKTSGVFIVLSPAFDVPIIQYY